MQPQLQKADYIFKDMYQAAINGANHVIARLVAVTADSNTTEVLLWMEKLGKMADSIKTLEAIIFDDTSNRLDIRGNAKLNKYELPEQN